MNSHREEVRDTLRVTMNSLRNYPGRIKFLLKQLQGWPDPTDTTWYQNGVEDIILVAQEVLDENP